MAVLTLTLKAEQAAIKTISPGVELERQPAAFQNPPRSMFSLSVFPSHLFQALSLPLHTLSLPSSLLVGPCEYPFSLPIYPLTLLLFSHPVFFKKNIIPFSGSTFIHLSHLFVSFSLPLAHSGLL